MATNSNGALNRDYSVDNPLSSKAAMDLAYASAPKGENGKKYKIVAGVLRNYGTPDFWECIIDGTHYPVNIESVTNGSASITVNYPSLGAVRNVSFVALPDETMINNGFTSFGASVTLTEAIITVSKCLPVSDYVSYNGSAWTSLNNVYTFTYTGGNLVCTHRDLFSNSSQDVSITPRGGTYDYRLSGTVSATTNTTVAIEIRDSAGTLLTVPDTNMKFALSHGPTSSPDVNALNIAGANIWVYGIFEV